MHRIEELIKKMLESKAYTFNNSNLKVRIWDDDILI